MSAIGKAQGESIRSASGVLGQQGRIREQLLSFIYLRLRKARSHRSPHKLESFPVDREITARIIP